jgi:hypothetical protein
MAEESLGEGGSLGVGEGQEEDAAQNGAGVAAR